MSYHKATNTTTQPPGTHAWRSNKKLVGAAILLALIGVPFLLREHWTHTAGYWPFLLLLACPLMHLFHGHGGHGQHGTVPNGR